MRVTIRVSPFAAVPQVVEFAKQCEAAGFDGIGLLDSQMINRDVFVTLGAVAAATDRLTLATAVTNPVTRHVSVLASAAASIDDLAPGRVHLWIGRGFSATNLIGAEQATTPALRDSIRDLRRLMAGEWDVFPGTHSHMRTANRRIPVYLAAAGPRTIRLAGEVADGLLLAGSLLPSSRQKALELIEEGAHRSGRNPGEIEVCHSLLTSIRPTREEALRWAGPLIALRLNDAEWLKEAGIDAKGAKLPSGLSGLYPDPMHAEDHRAAMDSAEEIPLELRIQIAERLGLIGTPEDCVTRLRDLAAEGVHHVYMRTVDTVSFPQPEVEAYREVIRAAVSDLT
jgi:5,10-methylenetetrahydromethanopterin reductase